MQDRFLTARVTEVDLFQFHQARRGCWDYGLCRVVDRRLGAQHLLDPVGAGDRPW